MRELTVGICAKNEENNIINCLKSILNALEDIEVKTKIVVCINGSSDNSALLVKEFIKNLNSNEIEIDLIEKDKGNLIEAERSIIKRSPSKYYCFIDADSIIEDNTIKLLYNEIKANDNCYAAYAKSLPHGEPKTILEKVMNEYTTNDKIFSKRHYLHGRCFIIKDWFVPKIKDSLLVDDIFLSYYLLSKYGAGSIVEVKDAIVYFKQIDTFRDYYYVYRRRNHEITRCMNNFPEFRNLPKEFSNKTFNFNYFLKIPLKKKLYWILFFVYKKISKFIYKFETLTKSIRNNNQWITSSTSKTKLIDSCLILIEGLDCSGKKTISKELLERLPQHQRSKINIGPLKDGILKRFINYCGVNKVPNFLRSLAYTIEAFMPFLNNNTVYFDNIIQVSSLYRSYAYSILNQKKLRIKLYESRLKKLKYDYIFYLTADYEDRLERHYKQVSKNQNNDDIDERFPSKDYFTKYDGLLENILKNQTSFAKTYNTSKLDIDDIVNDILVNIKK